MQNEIKTVAVYCRVSTEEQKKFGISVQDQKNSLTRYCKNNNFKIYDYYIDEGISAGTISKRKEFVRLLKDLDKIDLIVFTKLDRFSRNVRDANNLLVELDKHNTAFRAIDEDDIDTSTADGRFIFNLKVNLAEHERNKDSERINRVNKYKYHTARTVCSGMKKFGYDISEDKKLIINEEEAKQLNELYDKYIETNCLGDTVRWFQTNVKKRSYESIRIYLSDTAYIGKYKHITKKTKEIEIIENFCPAIIDEEKFKKVQKMLGVNIKRYNKGLEKENGNKTDYIFSGLLYCKCGYKLAGKHSKGKHYYICKRSLTTLCDNKVHISEIALENYLLENITDYVTEKIEVLKRCEIKRLETINKTKPYSKKKEMEKIKNKMEKLGNLYLDDMIDVDYYKKEYNNLKQQLNVVENMKEIKEDIIDYTALINFLNSNFLPIYNSLENDEKREAWFSIIENITFNSKTDFNINLSCTKP